MRPDTSSPALARLRQWTAAKCDRAKWPFRWTRMTSSQSDSSMLKLILSRRMPALLTRMSSLPQASTAWATRASAPAHELTSLLLSRASPPAALMSCTVCSAGCTSLPSPARAGADVVDDDLGTLGGEQQGLRAPDPAAGAADDGGLPLEHAHQVSSCFCFTASCPASAAGLPRHVDAGSGTRAAWPMALARVNTAKRRDGPPRAPTTTTSERERGRHDGDDPLRSPHSRRLHPAVVGRGGRGAPAARCAARPAARRTTTPGPSARAAGPTPCRGRRRAGTPRSTPGRSCTRTTCRPSTSGCPTWPRSSTWPRGPA